MQQEAHHADTAREAHSASLSELVCITRSIIDPAKELKDLIPDAIALRDLFESMSGFRIDHEKDIGAGQTRLDSGLAISPTLAAMCIRELYRTTAFIRGLHDAIADAAQTDRPTRVLYAGCGPYALLAVPLMATLPKGHATFTLMDIHPECLEKARELITSLGLSSCVEDCLCTDAARYRIPADRMPDVIVSETMAVCLHNEPQVSIARNLLTQAPGARMVPQSVSVGAALLNFSREHVLMPADYVGEFPEPDRDRIYLGKIFELDAAGIENWRHIGGDTLPAGSVKIPSPLERRYSPYLLTDIVVYGRHRLQDYDCSLTSPQRLKGDIRAGDELQFRYLLGNDPRLIHETVPGKTDLQHMKSDSLPAVPTESY